jgi:knotted carbamoyltransferase YgeW
MISFCADAIGIRDDMFLGAGNAYMREVGEALDDGHKQGVLPQRPALINLQCDIDHPTQSMADLAWLREHFGSLENLKGKKIAMTWAYSPSYGKPLSVPQGIIGLMTRFGMDVTLAHPEGYDLIPDVIEVAKNNAQASGGSFRQVNSMEEAFKDADIVYPKSWAPYKVMEKRTELLRANDHEGLKALEKACLEQNAGHKDWHCTEEMMKHTRDGEALYALPAGGYHRRLLRRGRSHRRGLREVPDPDLQRGKLEAVHHRRDDRLPQIREPGQGAGAAAQGRAETHQIIPGWPAGQPHDCRTSKDKDRVCLLSH